MDPNKTNRPADHPCTNCTHDCFNGWMRWNGSDYPCGAPDRYAKAKAEAATAENAPA